MRELERQVLLSVLDRKWREHLYEMDYLREGIGLRAYSQRDPLVEYQREGFDMFNAMKEGIREETVGFLFNLEVQVEEEDEAEIDVEPDSPLPTRSGAPGAADRPSSTTTTTAGTATSTTRRTSSPRACRRRARRRTSPTPPRARTARPRSRAARRSATPTTPTPASAATTLCPCGSGKKYKKCHGRPGRTDRPQGPRRRLSPRLSRTAGRCSTSVRRPARCGRRWRASVRRGGRGR